MPELPSGTVTFLFTDIEESPALWYRDRPRMAAAVVRLPGLLQKDIREHDGVLFKVARDAVHAGFPTSSQSLRRAGAGWQPVTR